MDIIEYPDIFLEFALPLVGATALIVALEHLYTNWEKRKEEKARHLNL